MGKGAVKYRNMLTPRQPGELARLRVLAGPDHGAVYVFQASRVTVGRGEENDVVLADLKASRRHAEIAIEPQGAVLYDVGSTHGIAVNGRKTGKQSPLRTGDKIGVGESVLEFVAAEAGATKILSAAPPATVPQAGTGASGYTQFIPRPAPGAAEPGAPRPKAGFIERNRKLILALGGLMLLSVLLPKVEQRHRARKLKYSEPKEIEAERTLGSIQMPDADKASMKASEQYFREGFRELRARNYLRARNAFETALQVNPAHSLAAVYLESTRKAMEAEAKTLIEDARKDEEANRIDAARSKYGAVKRLFSRERGAAPYKEADSRMSDLDQRLKGEGK